MACDGSWPAALLSSVVFGWFGRLYNRAKNEARLLDEISVLSPVATFSFEKNKPAGTPPPGPKFLRDWCGDNLFGYVESLTIRYNYWQGDEDVAFEKIGGFHELKQLTIEGDAGLDNIEVLGQLEMLRELNLSLCEDVRDLSPIIKIRKLEKLYLSLNGFEDYSCIAKIPTLKELSIGHPYRGYEDWAWLSDLESVEILDLSSSRIIMLPPLGKLKRLKKLDLTHCSRLESSLPVAELANLTELAIGRGTPLQIIDKIEDLMKLERLENSLVQEPSNGFQTTRGNQSSNSKRRSNSALRHCCLFA